MFLRGEKMPEEKMLEQKLIMCEKKLKAIEDYFSIIHDTNRPIKNELAIKAISRIVKDAETIELKCIKAICDEALYS
jgi:hypothetical protein